MAACCCWDAQHEHTNDCVHNRTILANLRELGYAVAIEGGEVKIIERPPEDG
jgi:hypothetical protein